MPRVYALMLCEMLLVTGKVVIAEALVLLSAFCKHLMLLSSSSHAVLQDFACHMLFWLGVVRAHMYDARCNIQLLICVTSSDKTRRVICCASRAA